MTDRDIPDDASRALLRLSTYTELDPDTRQAFFEAAGHIEDWSDLATQAESNALSALLYGHLVDLGIDIPDEHRLTFRALAARHQRNNRERSAALEEILQQFNQAGIDAILLKGMALIHVLYTDKFQRPMGDIDVLVAADRALDAQQCLRDIGYNAGDRKSGYLYDHHHLPVATKTWNSMPIQVEVHHNALSGDVNADLSFDRVFSRCLPVMVGEQSAFVMGHEDALLHLCHHTFEPVERIKLGAVADIYSYVIKFGGEVDWESLRRNAPFVCNTLRCLHYLSPMPEIAARELGRPETPAPAGVGRGFTPMSRVMASRKSRLEKLRTLLDCPDWWRHIHYQVAPEKSLAWVKLVRHPLTVSGWVGRRYLAKAKSRFFQG